jgi:hypothetical protein
LGQTLILPSLGFLAFAIWRNRHLKKSKRRTGLLNSSFRPPLSLKERTHYTAMLSQEALSYRKMQRSDKIVPNTDYEIINLEIIRLIKIWTQGIDPALSDDELRSIGLLHRATRLKNGQFEPLFPEDEAVLADMETVAALRQKISELLNSQAQCQSEYKLWLEQIGDPDASHLIKDGWIPFLESFEKPDIHLWNNIATDFHELYGDRLDASFWIAAQPECDRATVWSFISGIIGYGDLKLKLRRAEQAGQSTSKVAEEFALIINRWNTGFHKWHSISYNPEFLPNEHISDGQSLNEKLAQLEVAFKVVFPRILDFDFDPSDPVDSLSRSVSSPFDFWDGTGLHLRYPNMWPISQS